MSGDDKQDLGLMKSPEPRPVGIVCNIHPWMQGWFFVQDHPYMTCSDNHGIAELKNLPVGKITLRLWQETLQFKLENIKPADEKQKLHRGGKLEIDVQPGMNDLGDFKVTPVKE